VATYAGGDRVPGLWFRGADGQALRPLASSARIELVPPYEDQLGRPSYEVCPNCGFEFGNDDNPGNAPPSSFEEYREEWRGSGASRFSQ
jgi:rubredoxin